MSSWFSTTVDVGCANSEGSDGVPMDVSEARDNFDLYQENIYTLEMVGFEGISFVSVHSWPSWAFALKGLDFREIFTVVEWYTRLVKAYFEATSVGILLLNFTKGKLKLVHSTQPVFFIQCSTDYVSKILEVIG